MGDVEPGVELHGVLHRRERTLVQVDLGVDDRDEEDEALEDGVVEVEDRQVQVVPDAVEGEHRLGEDGAGEQQALVLADRRSDWDAFILDIGMPDMTGHELVGHLRRRAGTGSACFIALTGYGQAHDHVTSQAAGFDHHLVKPADVDRIVALLAG